MDSMNNHEPIKRKGNTHSVKDLRAMERRARKRQAIERRKERRLERRDELSRELRKNVYKRYGTLCYLCGKDGADTIDHVIPLIKGGNHDLKNLRPAHEACNQEKGAKIIVLPEELEAAGW